LSHILVLVDAQVGTLPEQIAVINAKLANQRLFRINRQILDDDVKIPNPLRALHPLVKETAGFGTGLPGQAAVVVAAVSVGDTVGAPFPATVGELRGLTNADLNQLSILFNDSFGVLAGDKLPAKKAKFQRFVIGL
jgi:hypothetical protein